MPESITSDRLADRGPAWLAPGIALCIAISAWAAWAKPPFLEEYWTAWFADPAKPLGRDLVLFWLADTPHPPLFNAVLWMFVPFPIDAVVARRLCNAAALVLPVVSVLLARDRRRSGDPWGALLLLALVSCPLIVAKFAWHRSYYLDLMTAGAIIVSLRAFHLGADRALANRCWLCALVLVGINLDYMFAVAILALLLAHAGVEILSGKWRRAIGLVALGTVAVALLAATALWALSEAPAQISYRNPFLEGMRSIVLVGGIAAAANLALLAFAVRGVRALPWREPSFAWTLVGATVLIVAVFLLLHALKGFLIPRQAFGLIAPSAALVVDAALARPIARAGWWAIVVNAVLIAVGGAVQEVRDAGVAGAVPAIRRAVAACPGRELIFVNSMDLAPPDSSIRLESGRPQALRIFLPRLARDNALPLQAAEDRPIPLRPAGPCGAVVWMEYGWSIVGLTPARLAAGARLAVSTDQLRAARIVSTGPGGVMMVVPGPRSQR